MRPFSTEIPPNSRQPIARRRKPHLPSEITTSSVSSSHSIAQQLSLQYSLQHASSPSHGLPASISTPHILPYGPLCTELLLVLVARDPYPCCLRRRVLLRAHCPYCRDVQERSRLRVYRLARVARSALSRRTVN